MTPSRTEIAAFSDHDLVTLYEDVAAVYHQRFPSRSERKRQAARTLSVGDRVRTKTNLSPKYLTGRTGTVRKVNQTTADVELDSWAGVNDRYVQTSKTGHFGTRFIRVPAVCLEAE